MRKYSSRLSIDSEEGSESVSRKSGHVYLMKRESVKTTILRWERQYQKYELLLFSLIAGDQAVFDVNYAVGVLGDIGFVRHQNDGIALLVKLRKQRHDLGASL